MDSNDSLSRTLKTWKVNLPPAPHFRTIVWERIQSIRPSQNATWGEYLRSHLALWVMVGAVSWVGAGWIGHSAGEARRQRASEALVAHYVQSLDPMAQPRDAQP